MFSTSESHHISISNLILGCLSGDFMKKRRSNTATARIVNRAIRIANLGFTDAAAVVCASHSVPFEVALRVITKPKQRRKQ